MSINKSKKNIQLGSFELSDDEFAPKNVKVRITTMLDEDVLESLRDYAEQRGVKYQTALNALLRAFFSRPAAKTSATNMSEATIRRIVRDELRKRA